jgi:tetratricopeptide (TPR) repeat protein
LLVLSVATAVLALAWPHLQKDAPADKNPEQIEADSSLEKEGDADKVPAKSEAELKADPGSYLASRFAQLQNDHRNSTDFIRDALAADPENLELKRQYYHLLLIEGNVDEALTVAKTITDKEILKSMASDVLTAVKMIKEKQYAEALPLIRSHDQGALNSIMMPLLTGWIKIGAQMIRGPVTIEQIMGKDAKPDTPFVAYHLALMNDVLGHTKEASEFYAMASKEPHKTPFRIIETAQNFYLRSGQADKASTLIEKTKEGGKQLSFDASVKGPVTPIVRDARDGVAELFYSIGSILYGVNAAEDEIVYLRMALYLNPQFPAAQYLLAAGLEQMKNISEAIKAYERIEKTSPLYLRGQVRIAQIEHERGDTQAAMEKLESIAKNPSYSEEALLAKGDLLRDMERFSEAAAVYTKVIAEITTPEPSDWVKYYARGIAYERAGEWPKAEADFKRALELEPDQPDVLNYIGYTWLTMNRHIPEAKAMIEKALSQRPNDAHIIDSMGWAYYLTGDFEQALEYLEQAVELMPGDVTTNDHLGDVYWRLGRKKEARFQWERALIFKPDAKTQAIIEDKIKNGMPPFVAPAMQAPAHEKSTGTSL